MTALSIRLDKSYIWKYVDAARSGLARRRANPLDGEFDRASSFNRVQIGDTDAAEDIKQHDGSLTTRLRV